MKKYMIAVVLLTVLCISIAKPVKTEAAVFLAAIPAIWAIIAIGMSGAAVIDNDGNDQQSQQAFLTPNEPTSVVPLKQIATVNPATTFSD